MTQAPATRSTTDEVYARLREQILTGDLPRGEQHSIYRLSAQLGVSRTPVREAVLRLADLGLVTIERNRGVTVRGVQAEDIRDVFELRLLLEVPAAAGEAARADEDLRVRLRAALEAMREAARRGDEVVFMRHDRDLHAALGESLGNRRLSQEVDRLRDSIQVRGVSTIDRTRSMVDIAEEHAPIVDAVTAGNAAAAADAMRAHLQHTAALLIEGVELRPWATGTS